MRISLAEPFPLYSFYSLPVDLEPGRQYQKIVPYSTILGGYCLLLNRIEVRDRVFNPLDSFRDIVRLRFVDLIKKKNTSCYHGKTGLKVLPV